MKRTLLSFLGGFLATLLCHQPMLWVFHALHLTDRMPYAMKGVPPFGVPAVISLAFWGGVWGVIMIPLIARARGAAWWLAAAAFGAVFPTLVAVFIIAPMKGAQLPGPIGKILVGGFILNAAWGLGTAIFFRLFGGK
jgi:hypothetical protein